MSLRRIVVLGSLAVLCSPFAIACSCANYTPIQQTYRRYRDRAVFTARVIQLMGKRYNWNGKRYSSKVLAVVHHRYWGLPWYWPKIVVLDGSYPCDIAMLEREEYLVAGYRGRYGVLEVNGCSRTQPLARAQVDLRTLDGSRCAAPGGTIIGRVWQAAGAKEEPSAAPNVSLSFRDAHGKTYTARSDAEGVYELQHLPPGPYVLESRFAPGQLATGEGSVVSGVCTDSPVSLGRYSVSGRLIPGLDRHARVKLTGARENRSYVKTGLIAPDGWFYFDFVPPGEYYLVVSVDLVGQPGKWADIYYPGTDRSDKAIAIRVSGQPAERPLEFAPGSLLLVPIPVIAELPGGGDPVQVGVRSQNSSGIVSERLSLTGIPTTLFGVRGESYKLLAYSSKEGNNPGLRSSSVHVTAAAGMKTVHLLLTAPR